MLHASFKFRWSYTVYTYALIYIATYLPCDFLASRRVSVNPQMVTGLNIPVMTSGVSQGSFVVPPPVGHDGYNKQPHSAIVGLGKYLYVKNPDL